MPETQFTQVQYTLQGLMNQIQMGQIGLPDIQHTELLGKEASQGKGSGLAMQHSARQAPRMTGIRGTNPTTAP